MAIRIRAGAKGSPLLRASGRHAEGRIYLRLSDRRGRSSHPRHPTLFPGRPGSSRRHERRPYENRCRPAPPFAALHACPHADGGMRGRRRTSRRRRGRQSRDGRGAGPLIAGRCEQIALRDDRAQGIPGKIPSAAAMPAARRLRPRTQHADDDARASTTKISRITCRIVSARARAERSAANCAPPNARSR